MSQQTVSQSTPRPPRPYKPGKKPNAPASVIDAQPETALVTPAPTPAPANGVGSVGTEAWVKSVIAQSRGRSFGKTDAATVEPLPADSDYISSSALIGVDICFVSLEITTSNYNNKPTTRAEYVIFIPSRPELGRRKVGLGSRRALAQAMALKIQDFPFIGTIELDEPAFEGARPGAIIADSWGNDANEYYHAPLGEVAPAF